MRRLQRSGLLLAVHLGAWLPLGYLAWQVWGRRAFFDPIGQVITRTGRLAILFLLLSLSCTPLATVSGWRWVLRARQALGLYAALYAALHALAFVGWDYAFDLALLEEAVLRQRFVLVGAGALVLLLGLAITSPRQMREALGRAWRRLQRAAYLAGALAVLHIMWAAKNPLERLPYAVILSALLILRLPWVRRGVTRLRRRLMQSSDGGGVD